MSFYFNIILIEWACIVVLASCCWIIYGEAKQYRARWLESMTEHNASYVRLIKYKERTIVLEDKIRYWKHQAGDKT